MIVIYTDGSSRGNPGPGGYGTVMKYKEHRKEMSQGYRKTTNNRMELLAIIVGLETIKVEKAKVKVYSDSKYVIDSVEKGWLWNWMKKDFKGKKNKDLWLRFADIYKKHYVTFQWVKGHAGIEENERCDQLAVEAAESNNHLIDEGFESGLYS
ncbi:ribonuclease HI [Roseivirga sp. E12]|uniref:ribonuclease HI n=1 Tax=Roseivirga sp. E12 TaxID=2819237 RepID=UPI001ABC33E9|nr:ribonuclease HI [Roseivirga sp. E12]MBO3697838.1 ribonuclease HI [Roseivirga sp. E12]